MRNADSVLGNVDLNDALLVVNNDNQYSHVYTINIPGEYGNVFYNMIIEGDSQGNFKEPYIYKYTLTYDFMDDYNQGFTDFSNFEGIIQKFLFSDGLRNEGEEMFYECWTLVFGDAITPPDLWGGGTGGGTGNGGGGTTVVVNNNGTISGSGGGGGSAALDASCFVCIGCTCVTPAHTCGDYCTCPSPPHWAIVPSCQSETPLVSGPGPSVKQNPNQNRGGENPTLDECINFLVECGIIIPEEFLPQEDPYDIIECFATAAEVMEDNHIPLCMLTKAERTLMAGNCCAANDFESCFLEEFYEDEAMATLFQDLQPVINFEDDHLCYLRENGEVINIIKELVDINGLEESTKTDD